MSNNRKRAIMRTSRLRNKHARKQTRDQRLAKKQAWQRGHLRKRQQSIPLMPVNSVLQALGAGLLGARNAR